MNMALPMVERQYPGVVHALRPALESYMSSRGQGANHSDAIEAANTKVPDELSVTNNKNNKTNRLSL